ncbi:hypothetical protein ACULX8_000797 [Cronobacter sakazakii]
MSNRHGAAGSGGAVFLLFIFFPARFSETFRYAPSSFFLLILIKLSRNRALQNTPFL